MKVHFNTVELYIIILMCIQLENGALVTCTLRTMKKHHVWTNDSVVFEARHCDLHHGPRGVRHDMRLHGLGTTITKQRSSSEGLCDERFLPNKRLVEDVFPNKKLVEDVFPNERTKMYVHRKKCTLDAEK